MKYLNYPGSVTDARSYASTGFLTNRTITAASTVIMDNAQTYDLRGLLTSAYTAYRRGQSSGFTAEMAYNGLGALVRSSNDLLSSGQSEDFRPDAIGNRLRIARPGFKPSGDSDFMGVRFMSYDPEARLTQVVDSATAFPDNFDLLETYQYDAAGTMNLQYLKEWNSGSGFIHDAMKSYPSIDDKLSVVNRQIGISAVSDETHPQAKRRIVNVEVCWINGC